MSTTINLADADTYFGVANHIMTSVWNGFSDNFKNAGIAYALRLLNRTFGLDIVNTETVRADDFYQPDRAVYEQALWSLMNSDAVPNGENTGPRFVSIVQNRADEPVDPTDIAPEAKRWLGFLNNTIQLLRA